MVIYTAVHLNPGSLCSPIKDDIVEEYLMSQKDSYDPVSRKSGSKTKYVM